MLKNWGPDASFPWLMVDVLKASSSHRENRFCHLTRTFFVPKPRDFQFSLSLSSP